MDIATCSDHNNFNSGQRYLKCYVDNEVGPCTSREECESQGYCSDDFWTRLRVDNEYYIDLLGYPHTPTLQNGSCLNSVYYNTYLPVKRPDCNPLVPGPA
jgi:hypothetical protein